MNIFLDLNDVEHQHDSLFSVAREDIIEFNKFHNKTQNGILSIYKNKVRQVCSKSEFARFSPEEKSLRKLVDTSLVCDETNPFMFKKEYLNDPLVRDDEGRIHILFQGIWIEFEWAHTYGCNSRDIICNINFALFGNDKKFKYVPILDFNEEYEII